MKTANIFEAHDIVTYRMPTQVRLTIQVTYRVPAIVRLMKEVTYILPTNVRLMKQFIYRVPQMLAHESLYLQRANKH